MKPLAKTLFHLYLAMSVMSLVARRLVLEEETQVFKRKWRWFWRLVET